MTNATDLKTRTVKELADMARKKKVLGWHEMRKDDLVRALVRKARQTEAKRRTVGANGAASANTATNGAATNGHGLKNGSPSPGVSLHANGHAKNGSNGHAGPHFKNGSLVKNGTVTNGALKNGAVKNGAAKNGIVKYATMKNGAAKNGTLKNSASKNGTAAHSMPVEHGPKPRTPQAEQRLQEIKSRLAEAKDLAIRTVGDSRGPTKDRLVVMVRDPYWLHAYWELGRRSVQRAEAAMGQHWHAAHPVLRIHELSRNGTTSASRQAVRDIEIHGGVNNWYIDVHNPPKSYQLEIGYLAPGNRFYCLARSNVVTTPTPGSADTFDRNWAEVAKDCDRVYAMTAGAVEQDSSGDLKDILEEHLHRPIGESLFTQFGGGASGSKQDFRFHIDTELIVHGKTQPDARVTLRGEPVRLRPDGSFAVRFSLPDRRHVLPVVANSGDGAEQRTIVLAIDRNTKVMEPLLRDPGE